MWLYGHMYFYVFDTHITNALVLTHLPYFAAGFEKKDHESVLERPRSITAGISYGTAEWDILIEEPPDSTAQVQGKNLYIKYSKQALRTIKGALGKVPSMFLEQIIGASTLDKDS